MNGNSQDAVGFIKGESLISIPYYQRNYDWKVSNCQRLFEDLVMLRKDNIPTHFFGSIVVKPGELNKQTIIIDGQQRITTLSLLILAIYNFVKSNELITEYNMDQIYANYLVDNTKRGAETIKLKSNPRDLEAYGRLFHDPKHFIEASNITRNYNFFYLELEDLKISIDDLIESIEKLEFIVVNLNSPDDDAQLIFESLNSTGLELGEADKIRNFLLMNEELSEQNYLFKTYWEKIEDLTEFDLNNFSRDYLTVKQFKYPNKANVYEEFKKFYYSNYNQQKRSFFDEFLDYALTYQQINQYDTSSKEINEILFRFQALDVSVLKPFLMIIIYDFNQEKLKEEEVIQILTIIESYIARRMITQKTSNALNKVFSVLYRDMNKLFEKEKQIISKPDIIGHILLSKINTAEFPKDEEVVRTLQQRDFYNINRRFRTYFFERLENESHNEMVSIYEKINDGTYSVEHIMPQKLSSEWRNELGENYEQIHNQYLHSLGNITLTGYNSKYSNRPFKEKKGMEYGFKDSRFKVLNKIPSTAEKWTENEIVQRTNDLTHRALNIWKLPKLNHVFTENDETLIPFEGEPDQFTNYLIKGYTFINDEYQPVDTWREMFNQVAQKLFVFDANPILEAVELERSSSALAFTFNKERLPKTSKIADGVYLLSGGSSNYQKLNVLRQLLDKYELDYDSLMIDAKPSDQ